jgi:hypothetical protein
VLASNEMHDLIDEIYEALMDAEYEIAIKKLNTLTLLVRDIKQTFTNEL